MLVGRERECAQIERLLGEARNGTSVALVIRGEAGIGKSALLGFARERAATTLVLSARGVEFEARLPFAGLSQLLAPALGRLQAVPPLERHALHRSLALGRRPAIRRDRFATYAATLSLLAAAAERQPLLALVDDAHWLDRASAEALAFTARRLGREGVALLLAAREDEPTVFDAAGVSELRLLGLDRRSATTLLRQVADAPVTQEVSERVWRATGGNPQALGELAGLLSEAQLAGREPLDDPLPVGRGIERAFRPRLAPLSAETRRALVIAAACDSGDLLEVSRAIRAVGLVARALEPAEAAGIVEIGETRISFCHPLVRSTAYRAAGGPERRAAHRALADALDAPHALQRKARHLAAGALGPDAHVAAQLEQAAEEARSRGAPAAAARAYETAAWLSPDGAERARRLTEAARDLYLAGRAEVAQGLLDAALEWGGDPVRRAEIQHVRAQAELFCRSPRSTRELLIAEAARIEELDAVRAAVMLMHAANTSFMTGEPHQALALATRAFQLAERAKGLVELAASIMLGTAFILCGEPRHGYPLIRRGEPLLKSEDLLPLGPIVAAVGQAHIWIERHESGRDLLARLVARARPEGFVSLLPHPLAGLADANFRLGAWTVAYANAVDSVALAEETGQVSELTNSLMRLALVEAGQGRVDACRVHARRSLEIADSLGVDSMQLLVTSVLGMLELGIGRIGEAIAKLEPAGRFSFERGLREPGVAPWAADLAEAYVRDDRRADAEQTVTVLDEQARGLGRAGALAAVARCRGLLAGRDSFDGHFEEALRYHARSPNPFERARTQLCFGERLRRARRRVQARERLRDALATFDHLGARPWAERARAELRASGETARRRDAFAAKSLTERELQVALVVAQGATTREAAAALFLSAKTVEFHLSHIYRKVGVRSRTELAGLLAREGVIGIRAVRTRAEE
jgi:DNA-binding CsgD family transcriptional regulator